LIFWPRWRSGSAERFSARWDRFTPEETGRAAGLPFLGAEAVILLGLDESKIAAGPALRKIGELLRNARGAAGARGVVMRARYPDCDAIVDRDGVEIRYERTAGRLAILLLPAWSAGAFPVLEDADPVPGTAFHGGVR